MEGQVRARARRIDQQQLLAGTGHSRHRRPAAERAGHRRKLSTVLEEGSADGPAAAQASAGSFHSATSRPLPTTSTQGSRYHSAASAPEGDGGNAANITPTSKAQGTAAPPPQRRVSQQEAAFVQHFSAAPALESCFVGGPPPAACGPTVMRPAWAGSQHWAGTGPAPMMAVAETGPAALLASLGVSDGPPLQASPNLQSPTDRSPGWPAAPPASVPEDRDLSALGITPAPLGRSARRWQLRRSGAAVQETPAPLARGASGLGAVGWPAAPAVQGAAAAAGGGGGSCGGRSSTARAAGAAHLAGFETAAVGPGLMSGSEPSEPGLGLPRGGREAALQPLGGGVRRFGLTHGSPGKVLPPQHGTSLHNAATVAALPLAVGSLAPGRSSCVSPAPRAQACDPAGGIPEPPLKAWNVRNILISLRHKAGENVRPLPRDCAPAQRSEEPRWDAAGECGAGLVSRRSRHSRLGPGSSLADGGWAGPGALLEPTQCSPYRPRAWHAQQEEDFSPLMRGLLAEPGSMQLPDSGVQCWDSEGGNSPNRLWGWPHSGGSARRRRGALGRAAGWLLERLHLR